MTSHGLKEDGALDSHRMERAGVPVNIITVFDNKVTVKLGEAIARAIRGRGVGCRKRPADCSRTRLFAMAITLATTAHLICRLKPSLGGTERGVEGGAQAGGGTTTGQTLTEDRVGGIGEGS